MMRLHSVVPLLLAAAILRAEPAAPAGPSVAPPAARSADGPPAATEAEARDLLGKSAAAEDDDEARTYARRALPALRRALESAPDDCGKLIVTGEALIRAGEAKDAKLTLGHALGLSCDEATVSSLAAWATEYAPDGTRRGPGAKLDVAESLYLHAASLYALDPSSADFAAMATGSAADVALARGEAERARELALQAVSGATSKDVRVRSGLVFLRAAGPLVGEGAATDLLAPLVDRETLQAILDARVAEIQRELQRKAGDPEVEVAAAFYSLFSGGDLGNALAYHHVTEAAKSGRKLIELEYLQGRVAEAMEKPDEAKRHYRLQLALFPQAGVTRLAVNSLGLLLVARGGSSEEMEDALRALDTVIAGSPAEAALIDTKAQLLRKMGRQAEAIETMERAQRIEPDEERAKMLAAWRGAQAHGE